MEVLAMQQGVNVIV